MPHLFKKFYACAVAIGALAASPLTLLSQEVIMQKAISLDLAHAIAQAALDDCRSHNYHPAIVVIDASGAIKVVLRERQRSAEHRYSAPQSFHRPRVQRKFKRSGEDMGNAKDTEHRSGQGCPRGRRRD